jgi:hypothetical protein
MYCGSFEYSFDVIVVLTGYRNTEAHPLKRPK